MKKIIVICGPTATGKTEFAVKIAKKFNGEIISADSRQIYKGMDIGTGKDVPNNSQYKIYKNYNNYSMGYYLLKGIPLWLVDIINPDQLFSAAEYQKLAWKVITDIRIRKKLPILVGGTGLYIKVVIDGIETIGIPQDWELRKNLEKLPLDDLQDKLQSLDKKKWISMNNSDQNNPRRLIRAIEIAKYKKSSSTNFSNLTNIVNNPLMIGLTAPNKFLYRNIDKRVDKRVKQGIINEIQSLLKKGYFWNLPSMSGLGYRVWKNYFDNKTGKKETIQRWKYAEHSFARRQLTWFKKDSRIIWFDIKKPESNKNIVDRIKKWI